MNLDDWVNQEEERISEMLASGSIDVREQNRLLKELYRDARGYEQEDREQYIEQYPGAGQ